MKMNLISSCAVAALALTSFAFGSAAQAAGPQIVAGPAADPDCYAPWSAETKFFKYPAKKGPYRIALANGFIANTWRIQMIQTAKAYAAQPEVGQDSRSSRSSRPARTSPAQISAINNFIDSGYDAIVVNAQNPTAFAPVIKRAKEAGVVLVAFDNILDTEDAINVNVDQKGSACCGRTGWSRTCPMAARSSKCAASPAPRSTPTATTASTRRSTRRARSGT